MTACAPSGDGGSADASADAGSGAAHTDTIKGTAIDKWQDSYLISERDNEPHPVKVRFTSIDTDPAAVQEQIDAYNVSASGQMIPALARAAGATEELKASDPLKWTGLMNTCKAQAEETILTELIFG